MKKILFFIIALFLFGIYARPAEAKVIHVEKGSAVINADELIEDDLFIAGESVDIKGDVIGDVYAGGNDVNVSGNIEGDLIIGGGKVNISGSIAQDLYVGGGDVTITQANIGDSVIVGAGSVNIDKESSIVGTLLAGAGVINNSASVGRNLYVGAGSLEMSGTVGSDAGLAAEKIILNKNAYIGNNLYYIANDETEISNEASVSGKTSRMSRPEGMNFDMMRANTQNKVFTSGLITGFKMLSFLSALVFGLFIIWFLPKTTENTVKEGLKKFWHTTLIGLITAFAVIPLLILLFVTGVGAELAFVLLLIFILFCILAKIVSGFALGIFLVGQLGWNKAKPYGIFALGLVTLSLISMAPFVNIFIGIFSFWFGLGLLTNKLLSCRGK